jgi:hypothetical protein
MATYMSPDPMAGKPAQRMRCEAVIFILLSLLVFRLVFICLSSIPAVFLVEIMSLSPFLNDSDKGQGLTASTSGCWGLRE